MDFQGPVSGSLQKSYIKVAPTSKCMETYNGNETDRNQLCTYFTKVNTCQVDSGGPILWTDPSTGRLNVIGVISNRFTCAESTPSLQTRVATATNMHWIRIILAGKSERNREREILIVSTFSPINEYCVKFLFLFFVIFQDNIIVIDCIIQSSSGNIEYIL